MPLRLFNTLTRRVEPFEPRQPGRVHMYTCGPTVYRYVHIGNLRSYLMADWLRRALMADGYEVIHVKNITDVGHMRQEMLERGEDKMIAAALAEGKTPAQIAAFYTEAFLRDEERLNILRASVYPRATAHIAEMIAIIEQLLAKGHAYEVQGNVYFDVASFAAYGQLSGNLPRELLEGVRVEADPLKRRPVDFALWKAAEPGRVLKWDSPWGPGFPGWHIECSAMAVKYLGPHLDIHTGGVDNIFPHHEDELAQSEACFGPPFVRYWVHGQHLLADGLKMAKSTGNAYTLDDLSARGFEPLDFRYLCLTAHYRTRLNFTFAALRAARCARWRLRQRIWDWADAVGDVPAEIPSDVRAATFHRRFWDAVHDDLQLPVALAVVWQMAHADLPPAEKLALVRDFDRVLGLDLAREVAERPPVPADIATVLTERAALRARGDYPAADALRARVQAAGFVVGDARGGTRVRPALRPDALVDCFSTAREVASRLDEPDQRDASVLLHVYGWPADVMRCVASVLHAADLGAHDVEIIAVDSQVERSDLWLDELAEREPRLRILRPDHPLGEAEGRNAALKQAVGRVLVLMDPSVEATGDFLTPLLVALAEPGVGVAGPWGLRSHNLRQFHEVTAGDVDAMQGYCFAFRRALVREVGLMDEKFRYYRHLDLDYSFRFRDRGYRIVALPGLPLVRHEHRGWDALGHDEREKRSKRNFYRFLAHWGQRYDLRVPESARH